MKRIFRLILPVALAWSLGSSFAATIELVEPRDQATVGLLLPGHREWLALPRAERVARFADVDGYRQKMKATGTAPARVRLSWRCRHSENIACRGVYDVKVLKCRDGRVHYETNGLAATEVELVNLEVGEAYAWTVRCGEDVNRARFRTEDAAPRLLVWEGVPNVRDLGGWKTRDGRRVRQGLVFRSAGLNDNAKTRLSHEDVLKLYDAGQLAPLFGAKGKEIADKLDSGKMSRDDYRLHKTFPCDRPAKGKLRGTASSREGIRTFFDIRTDLDLRQGDSECWGMTESPLGPKVAWLNVPGSAYGGLGSKKGRDAFKRAFEVFLDQARYGIVFHCIGGADRTGAVAFILNGLLGVDEEDLWKDWEFTGFGGQGPHFLHKTNLMKLVAVFDEYPGKTINERIEAYVKSLGFADGDIAKFRNLMLEER